MKTKEKISLILLVVIYLLVTIRYFPNRPMDTLRGTLRHLLESVPYIIGFTIITVSVIQKVLGAKLPRDRIVRIYLTLGLIAEFLYGIYHYVNQGQV